jgi:hypothetical protein
MAATWEPDAIRTVGMSQHRRFDMARSRWLDDARDTLSDTVENARNRLPDARRVRSVLSTWPRHQERRFDESTVIAIAIGAFALGAVVMATLALRATRAKPSPGREDDASDRPSGADVTLAPDHAVS